MNKAVKGESGADSRVTIINKVFDLHRRNVHYSIRKLRPHIYEAFVKKIQNIPLDILEESFDIYKAAKEEKGTLPHPNYFLKVALNKLELLKENEDLDENCKPIKPLWGKTI